MLKNLVESNMGKDVFKRMPNMFYYIGALFLFFLCSNLIGLLGFKSPNIACMIDSVENKENGMVGGKGVGFSIGDHNARIFYWKEYQPNTFNMELKSIIKEREEQGLYLDNNHYSIL